MILTKINLHIHTIYSDGKESINNIVSKAIELDLNVIAFTDHLSNSWKSNAMSTLSTPEIIENYIEEIKDSQKIAKEKGETIKILKGVEIDLGSSEQFIKKLIQCEKFDLILWEYLETPESIAFVKNIINDWRRRVNKDMKWPLMGLAHFDPSHFFYKGLDNLIRFLIEYGFYFEFNSSYSEFYSRQNIVFFEALKESNVPVGIGCDSHDLSNLLDIEEPLEMIQYYGLEKNFEKFLEIVKKK